MSYKYTKCIDDIKIPMEEKEVNNAETMWFRAGTTGPKGGDSRYDCKTIIEFDDDGCTDMRILPMLDSISLSTIISNVGSYDQRVGQFVVCEQDIPKLLKELRNNYTGISIQFDGDFALFDLIEGLQFMIDTLKRTSRNVSPGQTWRHFKGGLIKIITVADHSESLEPFVIYKCESGTYARPLDMFLSEVDHDKYPDSEQQYRFELVPNSEVNNED